MTKYIIKRFLILMGVLFFVSVIIFILINKQPGRPYLHMINPNTSADLVEKKLRQLGYYDPMHIKYMKWFLRVLRFDLGYSVKYSRPVIEVIGSRVFNTFVLMGTSLATSAALGVFLGIIAAVKKNTIIDDALTMLSFIGVSIPVFFISLLLIKRFSYDIPLLPSSGMYDVRHEFRGFAKTLDLAKHLVLPVITLTIFQATAFVRYTRAAMIEVLDNDYIKAAMAKGMSFKRVLIKHALKNALIPIVTIFCLQIPTLFSGALMTETVFVWPGIGRLSYDAVQNRDYPLIMGILMIGAIFILISNFLADILYVCIDRRIEAR